MHISKHGPSTHEVDFNVKSALPDILFKIKTPGPLVWVGDEWGDLWKADKHSQGFL